VTLGEPKKLKDTLVHVPVTIAIPPGTRPMVHLDTVQGEAGRVLFHVASQDQRVVIGSAICCPTSNA